MEREHICDAAMSNRRTIARRCPDFSNYFTEKLREQYAAELKKVTQLQKQWALRKPVLDAHCLTLQKEILRLEQEVDALVMEKLNGDGGSSAHEIGT